jgi:transmembrane 9 superfamily member 2/4
MLQGNSTCRTLCRSQVPPEDAKFINERIEEDYAINWLIDGLPAAELKRDNKTGDVFFDMGFNLGDDEGEYAATPALNNHYDIVLESVPFSPGLSIELSRLHLRYHSPQPGVYRIVGVLVWPSR